MDTHETPPTSDAHAPQERRGYAFLVCWQGGDRRVEKNVLRSATLIGSGERCHLRLVSHDVDAAHAVISYDDKEFRIWDLRTKTGVLVNGQRVAFAKLHDGDRIQIAGFEFTFRTDLISPSRKGMFIDDYRVLGLLGTGGMGWLYRVENFKTGEQFALKVLTRRGDHRGLDDQELKIRFHFEGRVGKQLSHKNLVQAMGYQHRSDIDYIVMELVEAITLQELVERDGRVPYPLACEVIRQAALALEYIHSKGPIHRDVKPANVLIEKDGTVKLCDFGLVLVGDDPLEKILAEKLQGDCLGTADFISPEQSHDSDNVDSRADLYSLGCTLYYALCGRIPFPAKNNQDKLVGHRTLQAAALTQFVDGLPTELLEIIQRTMEKSPEKRFASLSEFAAAMADFSVRQPVEFDFAHLLKLRNRQARARLLDVHREHHLERIVPSIAQQVLQTTAPSPSERFEASRNVPRPLSHQAAPSHSPDDTVPSSAHPEDFVRNLPEDLRQLVQQWKQLPVDVQREITELAKTANRLFADDQA
ncbi:FHA domain-containing serine/threonine-protein kinase [Lacunimicrobium album]